MIGETNIVSSSGDPKTGVAVKAINYKINPINILFNKIITTNSTLIMNEATKAIRNLSKTAEVIHTLQQGKRLD